MHLKKHRPLITLKQARISREILERELPLIIREHSETRQREAQVSTLLEAEINDLKPKVEQLAGVLGETQDYLKTLPDPSSDVEKWLRARLLQRIGRLLEVVPRTSTFAG